jgi:acetoacetyl-CoA synthetase
MQEPAVLRLPAPDALDTTAIGRFISWLDHHGHPGLSSYDDLWRWSVDDLDGFWAALWEFTDVRSATPYAAVLESPVMPGTRWFPGATLNYAEHALRQRGSGPAIVALSQTRDRIEVSCDGLRDRVAAVRAGLEAAGVRPGDRVAAYLPNIPEAAIAFLAAASMGAVWSSCAPEFGVQAVLDRFGQIEPTVLLVVDGYRYGSRDIDRAGEVASIRAGLPSVHTTVMLRVLHPEAPLPDGVLGWEAFERSEARGDELEFLPVPFDHPLYVLYSSGTTGLPKPIVHGHGGILLVHLKDVGLMSDIGPGDRFFWFSTTGWMMWNYLMSGLVVGATIVLFDGDPAWPGLDALWRLAADEGVTWFGASAPFLVACRKAGLTPGRDLDLSTLRAVGSTGAPLPPEGFRWVYEAVKDDVLLSSISGGTDICSAFVGASPLTPVWEGEIPCRFLGCAVEAFDEMGRSVVGEQGELVVTRPLPSMPIGFWNDPNGTRYSAAYFDTYPGVWRHGDWITITERGSCVITGRSDATLNRSGVRIGTAEIYRVVDALDGVADSLMVHLEDPTGEGPGTLVLLVALPDRSTELPPGLVDTIRRVLRTQLSPRHVPDEVHAVPAIPTTLSGKKLELPVKKILLGADPDAVASRGALKEPGVLDDISALARTR